MVKSDDSKLKSEEQDDSKDLTEVIDDAASEETDEEEGDTGGARPLATEEQPALSQDYEEPTGGLIPEDY